MPVSISDLAFGWQSSGNITSVADAVDFFMINNFPYFAFDAQGGFSNTSWNDFLNDMAYFESIANGRPLLVTQVRLWFCDLKVEFILIDNKRLPSLILPAHLISWAMFV